MGKGSAGVVVSYERRGKVCDWLPLADRLVDAGHRVLLFKRNNMVEPEEDTVAMAERLRKEGVTKVFLVGGIDGRTLSALAAGALTFPVAGVVSVSGVVQPEDVAGLKAPFLQVGGDQDGLAPLDMVRAAHDAAVKLGRPPAGHPSQQGARQPALHRRSGTEGARHRHGLHQEVQGLSSTRLSWKTAPPAHVGVALVDGGVDVRAAAHVLEPVALGGGDHAGAHAVGDLDLRPRTRRGR